jgi:hypothetical protein
MVSQFKIKLNKKTYEILQMYEQIKRKDELEGILIVNYLRVIKFSER